MAASFGEQLRLAREARGVSLRHISDQTRISIRYLEAIEADDYKRLPGGIFNRSFIKAYARQIGFDEKEAVEGYLRTAREQGESEEVATTPYRSHVYTDGGSSRSPLVTLALTILILAILSLGVYAAVHWYQRREAARDQQSVTLPNTPQQPPSPTNQNSSTAQNAAAAQFKNISITARDKDVYIGWQMDDAKRLSPGYLGPSKPPIGPLNPQERLTIRYDKKDAPSLEITIDGHQVKNVPEDKIQLEITKDNYESFLR